MLSVREEAEILRLFGARKSEKWIADVTTNPLSVVVEVINRRAAGDREAAKREALKYAAHGGAEPSPHAPPLPGAVASAASPEQAPDADVADEREAQADEAEADEAAPGASYLDDLIARAAASPKATTRALGTRLAGMATQLQQVLQVEDETAAARDAEQRAREEARERLRAAQQALAAAQAEVRQLAKKAPAASAGAAPASTSTVPTALVRTWAAANGITCPRVGRVPRSVTEAYAEAHQTSQTNASQEGNR